MSSTGVEGEEQRDSRGIVRSIVQALGGARWTPGRKALNSGRRSPTSSEDEASVKVEQTEGTLRREESCLDSTESGREIRFAMDENLFTSDQNLRSEFQRLSRTEFSGIESSSTFPPGQLQGAESLGRNDAVSGVGFGTAHEEEAFSHFHPASPLSRNIRTVFSAAREVVRFSPQHQMEPVVAFGGGSVYGGTDFFTRNGYQDSVNVTSRDSKRPKERARAKHTNSDFPWGLRGEGDMNLLLLLDLGLLH
jgi:hypothetical protein